VGLIDTSSQLGGERVEALRRKLVDGALAEACPVLQRHAAEADRAGVFPVASINALRGCGLMGLVVPAEYGGVGGDLHDLAYAAQRLAGGCLSTALAWVMHCQQVDTIVRFATRSLQDRLLPRVGRDGYYIASVTAESGTGGALLRGREALVLEGAGFRLDRSAPVVTGGAHADGFLVKMRTALDTAETDVSLVFADRADVDVQCGPGWDAVGMRATENVAMVLRGTIPADQIVGGMSGFRQVTIEAFAAFAHIGWGASWLGAARAGLSALIREIRAGKHVRVDVGSDLVRHRIARIRCRLESVSAYLRCVLDEVQARRSRAESLEVPAVQIHLNTLKVLAAQQTFAAVNEMVELAGLRTGYLRTGPVPLERLWRDLRSASLSYDDNQLLVSNGSLSLLDPAVTTAGDWPAATVREVDQNVE
jgi:acyl-CoA dehydrogenase